MSTVSFLQSDVDSAPKTNGLKVETIRGMLREQQRECQVPLQPGMQHAGMQQHLLQEPCICPLPLFPFAMQALHSNETFREFRGQDKRRLGGPKHLAPEPKKGPLIDDYDAEGQVCSVNSAGRMLRHQVKQAHLHCLSLLTFKLQARMFDLIKRTALKEEKPLQGVWASFGKPYIPLGDPQEVQVQLRCAALFIGIHMSQNGMQHIMDCQ